MEPMAMVDEYLRNFPTDRVREARTTLLLMLDVARAAGEANGSREMRELVTKELGR